MSSKPYTTHHSSIQNSFSAFLASQLWISDLNEKWSVTLVKKVSYSEIYVSHNSKYHNQQWNTVAEVFWLMTTLTLGKRWKSNVIFYWLWTRSVLISYHHISYVYVLLYTSVNKLCCWPGHFICSSHHKSTSQNTKTVFLHFSPYFLFLYFINIFTLITINTYYSTLHIRKLQI